MTPLSMFRGDAILEIGQHAARPRPGNIRAFVRIAALSDALLLRTAGRHPPPRQREFWEIPWLEAEDAHKAWQMSCKLW